MARPKKEVSEETPKKKKSKADLVREVATALNKEHARTGGRATVCTGTDLKPRARIPTGILTLDHFMGGGFPRGCHSMFWGPEGAGKTTLCLKTIASIQQRDSDAVVVFIDGSSRLKTMLDYVAALGVDLTRFFLIEGESIEHAMDVVRKLARQGLIDICIVDDLAVASTVKERWEKAGKGAERGIDSQSMAVQAHANSHFIRVMTPIFSREEIACIYTQQARANLTPMSMEEYTLTGGHMLKHILSLCMLLTRGASAEAPTTDSKVPTKDNRCGFALRTKMTKMSVDGAQFTGSVAITQWVDGKTIEPGRDAYMFLYKNGLVTSSGAWKRLSSELFPKLEEAAKSFNTTLAALGITEDISFQSRADMENFLAHDSVYTLVYNALVPNIHLQTNSNKKDLSAVQATIENPGEVEEDLVGIEESIVNQTFENSREDDEDGSN